MKVERRMCKSIKTQNKQNVAAVKGEKVWYGDRCTNFIIDEEEDFILGKSCLIWFHFRCKGLKKAPKAAKCFCHQCYALTFN